MEKRLRPVAKLSHRTEASRFCHAAVAASADAVASAGGGGDGGDGGGGGGGLAAEWFYRLLMGVALPVAVSSVSNVLLPG